jgi:hypothetical protein
VLSTRAYDLHGLLKLHVVGETVETVDRGVTLAECETEPETTPPDVRWLPDLESTPPPSHAVPIRVSSEDDKPGAYVVVDPTGRWDCYGANHHLFAVFQEILLRRRVSLVHACGLGWDGHGVVLCGRGGVGKSSVAFATHSEPRLQLLSDDIILMRETGELLSFPGPLSVYPYHHDLLPGAVQAKLRAGKARSRVLGPLESLALTRSLGHAARRLLVARGGRIGVAAAKVRANYERVPRRTIFPAENLIDRAQIELGLYLSRGGDRWSVKDLQLDRARSLYLATTYEELELSRPLALYAINGAINLPCHWRRASEVSERFLGSAGQLLKISVPSGALPQEVQEFVLQTIIKQVG